MLGVIFMYLFMIPLCFLKKSYWLVQMLLLLSMFMFMMKGMSAFMWVEISMNFSYDMLSYGMIILSIWICSLMLTASNLVYKMENFSNLFLMMILFMLILLILTFSSLDYYLFYFFFEGSLIPTLMLILGWGYQPERLQAGMYLMFYTLFASLPLFIVLMWLYNSVKSLSMVMMVELNMNYLYVFFILAFLFKMPMYFVHLWLPKAHVEAPISGSMILAGVLLKLGGYGLIRVFLMLVHIIKMNSLFMSISMFGGMIVSLICLMQSDLKVLIAYSSVVHMGMVLGGIFSLNSWGFIGAYVLMIAHGLCSSGLFCLANIVYERLGSRSMLINKGLINMMPSMSLFWFLLCSSNMAAPPTMNLLGEIMLINSLVSWSIFMMVVISLMSFLSASYSLYLFSYTQHGKNFMTYSFMEGTVREYLLMLLHWFPLNILIMKSNLLMILL
uniref:NADH dehydrogenase subunit 4 n=1 Tax=Pulex irritans TaxID=173820 RepID=UPI0020298DD4|nr:NADH dehydrogenase subunit 4 [Pulex irritans]UPV72703.1 NADH dehydrogenase subunit 4 [Pulex irritans]